ncbi:helix-turn-helix transcriptional regulator [Aquimarina sp. U1-2]|uniref:helix-turn-helix domain-containing protein n=1 Tax=Aquimarina sp. U1-2 TaxID=2823141 RepID=UPI001AECEDE5|nr:helix-turn-helix transcriptional regulator [Aquimarina sp. U1-2]
MNKELSIRDFEVRDIVIDTANGLETDYSETFNVISTIIPEHIGSGYLTGTSFANGIGVIEASYELKNDLVFQLKKGVIHPLKFVFNLGDPIQHSFSESGEKTTILQYENLIVSSNSVDSHVFHIPKDKKISLFSVEINRRQFDSRVEQFAGTLDQSLIELFRDVNSVHLFHYKAGYSLAIADIIQEYKDSKLNGFVKSLYKEAKVNEILYHQLLQYLDDRNKGANKIIRTADLKTISEASEYIKENLSEQITIDDLSRRFAISKQKLQSGFRRQYKLSVHEYVQKLRLERLAYLLENSDLNITEIGYELGISSKSYLSKIFKDRYGVTPRVYRERKKSNTY